MKKIGLVFIIMLLASFAISLGKSSGWSRTYGGTEADGALSLIETADGGYCFAGYTRSFGAGKEDYWLVKLDSSGNMIWNQTYGGEAADFAFSVIATSDAGYAVVGYTGSFGAGGNDFWLIKTDISGYMEWNRTFGGVDDDYACALAETEDSGYILAGYTRSYGAGRDDYWLIKTDSYGNVEWNRTFGGWDDDGAIALIVCNDGGYALAGMTESFGHGSDRDDFWLVKTDFSGNMEWNRTYGGTIREYGFCLVQTSDSGYGFAGSTCSFGAGNHDSWLVKIDAFGNMEWNQTYGGADVDGTTSLIQTFDGGYMLSGTTRSSGYGEDDFWLVKTDKKGNIMWNMTYGGDGNDISSSLVEISDGGYAIAGYTNSVGVGNFDAWLVITDEHGNIPEFPSWMIFLLFLIFTLWTLVINRNHSKGLLAQKQD
jgi:hypothetical protein